MKRNLVTILLSLVAAALLGAVAPARAAHVSGKPRKTIFRSRCGKLSPFPIASK